MALRERHIVMMRRTTTPLTFLGLHPLHHCKLWYFLTFGAFACITPYLPLFYRGWGVTADQVGFINCLRPLVSFCVTPLWGAAADASGRHNVILFAMMLVQGYGYAGLSQIPHHFHALFAYVVALEVMCCANNTLADSATGQMCRRAAARGEKVLGGVSYGDQRLWVGRATKGGRLGRGMVRVLDPQARTFFFFFFSSRRVFAVCPAGAAARDAFQSDDKVSRSTRSCRPSPSMLTHETMMIESDGRDGKT